MKDFKTFILRGNVVDLAVGIVIGIAFGAVVASFVKDIIMPPIGLVLGHIDFSALQAQIGMDAKGQPVAIRYGTFINSVISLVIVVGVVFFLVVKPVARQQRPQPAAEPTSRECPECLTAIPIKARRCPACTSTVSPSVSS